MILAFVLVRNLSEKRVGPTIAPTPRVFLNEILQAVYQEVRPLIEVNQGVFGIFRGPKLRIDDQKQFSEGDFYFYPRAIDFETESKGSLTLKKEDGSFLTYRSAGQVRVEFVLSARGLSLATSLKTVEKLLQYFFDNRVFAAVVPQALSSQKELYEYLLSLKAEIRPLKTGGQVSLQSNIEFPFEYVGPFHSGMTHAQSAPVRKRAWLYQQQNVPELLAPKERREESEK